MEEKREREPHTEKKENYRREQRNDKWWSGKEMLLAKKHEHTIQHHTTTTAMPIMVVEKAKKKAQQIFLVNLTTVETTQTNHAIFCCCSSGACFFSPSFSLLHLFVHPTFSGKIATFCWLLLFAFVLKWIRWNKTEILALFGSSFYLLAMLDALLFSSIPNWLHRTFTFALQRNTVQFATLAHGLKIIF